MRSTSLLVACLYLAFGAGAPAALSSASAEAADNIALSSMDCPEASATLTMPSVSCKGGSSKPVSASQQAFCRLAEEYFQECFQTNPNWATETGVHDFDGQLPDFCLGAIQKRSLSLKSYLRRFQAISPCRLDSFCQSDRELIIAHIRAALLELEEIQNWRRNPDLYSSLVGESIFGLIKRDFAPLPERLRSVISRENQIPALLAQARNNLSDPPRVFTEVALEQLPGTVAFFENSVRQTFASVGDPQLQAEFASANKTAAEELRAYGLFLKNDLLPRSNGQFALGPEKFQKKLLFEEMVGEPLDSLLRKGYAELSRLQNQFREQAGKIAPDKPASEVFASVAADHPQPGELIASVQAVLSQIRDLCSRGGIVTIPAEDDLKVEETPPFMRALSFASMDTPGPLETKATEAYYNVTLPESSWTSTKTEEHMRSFCRGDLLNTSVHEAYPGHYVQGLWMRLAPSKTRKLLGCDSNSEGWAHYCEEMMTEQGLGAGDPSLKLVQLHDALLRACRYIVGIEMHTRNMSLEDATKFFIEQGYQERANAEREARRGTMDPTYLVYTLGKMQILALRDDYKKARGDSFSLKEFHNNFLAQGCPPVRIVRQALLGNKKSAAVGRSRK